MTRQRNDDKSTEFGLWLRQQPELDSRRFGFDAENLDYIWHDYVNGRLMLIEEKRHGAQLSFAQRDTHSIIDQAMSFACEWGVFDRLKSDRPREIRYYGYHVIRFEHTSPEDGWVEIDGERTTADDLKRFLRFEGVSARRVVVPAQGTNTLRTIAVRGRQRN